MSTGAIVAIAVCVTVILLSLVADNMFANWMRLKAGGDAAEPKGDTKP